MRPNRWGQREPHLSIKPNSAGRPGEVNFRWTSWVRISPRTTLPLWARITPRKSSRKCTAAKSDNTNGEANFQKKSTPAQKKKRQRSRGACGGKLTRTGSLHRPPPYGCGLHRPRSPVVTALLWAAVLEASPQLRVEHRER